MLAILLCTALAASPAEAPKKPEATARRVKIEVTEKGFEPNAIEAKAGEKLVLEVTRKTDKTCAVRFVMPAQNIDREMPLNKTVEIPVDADKPGKLPFGCQMGMMINGAVLLR